MYVKHAREARGWSQEGLANQLTKHLDLNVGGQSGMARIERGARPTRLNEAVLISNFLGLDLPHILTGTVGLWGEEEPGDEAIRQAEAELAKEMARVEQASNELTVIQTTLEQVNANYARVRNERSEIGRAHV